MFVCHLPMMMAFAAVFPNSVEPLGLWLYDHWGALGWVLFVLATIIYLVRFSQWYQVKQELEHLALHDGLTGLPNRLLFFDRLNQTVRLARRHSQSFGVVVVDLDHFKEVNDTLGHNAGDRLLLEMVSRLQEALRETDTVSRLGGDEFALILSGPQTEESMKLVALKVLNVLEEPVMLDNIPLNVSGSLGISLFPDHGETGEILLKNADIAMYEAKRKRNAYALYDRTRDNRSREKILLQHELRQAIKEEQLEVHFQPKVNCATKIVKGVEALCRWTLEGQGPISPAIFIPLAKQTGIIQQLTQVVLKKAIKQASLWFHSGDILTVSVNITGENIEDVFFPAHLEELLNQYDFPPQLLELEITEDVIIGNIKRATIVTQSLQAMGVKIAIDDFGTGNSSISYLKKLPIGTLKIDQSFIKEMLSSDNDMAIVRATIELSKSLGLRVVAEGVEDEETLNVLHQLNCDVVQGYLISRPLPIDAMTRWLRESDWANRIQVSNAEHYTDPLDSSEAGPSSPQDNSQSA